MIQNLKIDIIYYDTPSDFEFEFNLGGCCHSRVLNSKTSSPKEMISCLSKAVGRSRVILILGKLSDSDGLFNLISKAIGAPLVEVNAEEYGIISGTASTVISGSLPLVSSDGLLSGCIIESGPQSIILMPGEKSLRKDIAENLIFQYITAVSRTPDTETVVTPDSAAEVDAENTVTEDTLAKEQAPEEEITEKAEEKAEENLSDIVVPPITSPAVDIPDIELPELDISLGTEPKEDEQAQAEELFEEIEQNENEQPVIIPSSEEKTIDIVIPDNNIESVNEEIEAPLDDDYIDIYVNTKEQQEEISADIDDNYIYNINDQSSDDIFGKSNSQEDENDDDEYEEYDTDISEYKGINTFMWIILGLMFIIVAVLIYMLVFVPISKDISVVEYVKQIFNT